MADELKDHQGDRYKDDQTFGAKAAEEAEQVERLELDDGTVLLATARTLGEPDEDEVYEVA